MATLTQAPAHTRRGNRRRFPLWLFVVLGAVVAAGVAGGVYLRHWIRKSVYEELFPGWSRKWDSEISVQKLSVSVFPVIRVVGDDLNFRQHGREGALPLLHARRVTVTAGIISLLVFKPHQFESVKVDGFEINIPPSGERPVDRSEKKQTSRKKFWIADMRTDNAVLRLLPKIPGRRPAEFHFRVVRLRGSGVDHDLSYHVETTVPKPPGLVRSDGKFGPWDFEKASEIKVSGDYDYTGADLSVFHAIRGILESHGRFKGRLTDIVATGSAEIPRFEAENARHPVDLKAKYECTVDGTNGDVRIRSLVADFLHSQISLHGSVAGKHEKRIAVVAEMTRGRLEDVLHFVLRQPKPPFTGAAAFHWNFDAPMKTHDMVDAMAITGSTALARVDPTRETTQEKLDAASAKAQGEPDKAGDIHVVSDVKGEIAVHNGMAHLSAVSFRVPGLLLSLSGTYGLRSEQLNLHGQAKLEAKLSETQTGAKHFFLKLLDPFFKRKNAGAVLPIHITGPANKPTVKMGL